jgi:hypothetical protein
VAATSFGVGARVAGHELREQRPDREHHFLDMGFVTSSRLHLIRLVGTGLFG